VEVADEMKAAMKLGQKLEEIVTQL